MTNLTTQMVAGPVIGSYIANDKGGIANRTKCAAEQFGNNAVTVGSQLLTLGATAATVKTLKNKPQAVQKIAGFMDKVIKKVAPAVRRDVNLVGESGKVFQTFEITHGKFADKLLKMSAKSKVFGALGLAAAGILYFIDHKHTYKMGQIDQKYTDRANIAA